VAEGEVVIERARTAAGDDGPAAVIDRLLDKERCEGRTDARLEERHRLTTMFELEDRMNAVLGVKVGDLAGPSVSSDPRNYVAEETGDCAREDIDLLPRWGAQMGRGLYEGAAVRIEFEDRVCGANESCRLRFRRSSTGSRAESRVAGGYS
jgi:hypothetical protein